MVIHKGILVLSLVLYIFLGLALAPLYLPAAVAHLKFLSLGALVWPRPASPSSCVQHRGSCCSQGSRFLNRRGWCPQFLKDKEGFFADLDSSLSSFYREYPGRAALAFTLFFLSWVLHAVEVYLMFWLLGHPISWGLALCLDALAMLFTALGFFIPAAVGVQEGGNILLALGFNLGFNPGRHLQHPAAPPGSLLAQPGPAGGLAGEVREISSEREGQVSSKPLPSPEAPLPAP